MNPVRAKIRTRWGQKKLVVSRQPILLNLNNLIPWKTHCKITNISSICKIASVLFSMSITLFKCFAIPFKFSLHKNLLYCLFVIGVWNYGRDLNKEHILCGRKRYAEHYGVEQSDETAETLLAHGVGTTHKTVCAEGQRGLKGLPLTVEKLHLAVALRTIPGTNHTQHAVAWRQRGGWSRTWT